MDTSNPVEVAEKHKIWARLRGTPEVGEFIIRGDSGITEQEFSTLESIWQNVEIPEFNKKVSGAIIKTVIRDYQMRVIKLAEQKKANVYPLNDRLRTQGISYAERKKAVIDKIAFYEARKKDAQQIIAQLPKVEIAPTEKWLRPEDIDTCKTMGVRYFIEKYWTTMIYELDTTKN